MIPETVKPENSETEKEEEIRELGRDELGEVAGAGNPFEDVPRVPLKPIDPDLRDKG